MADEERFLCKDELLREAILDGTLSRETLKILATAKIRPLTPEMADWALRVMARLSHGEKQRSEG